MGNPCLEAAVRELERAGGTTRAVDRVVTVSATPSTPRAAWAARGDVRRLLRLDGMTLRQGGLPKSAGGASSSIRPSGSRRTAKTDGSESVSIRDVYHGGRQ